MYLNKQILMGFLGKDPELKTLQSGTVVANCSIATKEVWKDAQGQRQEKTEWHNLTIWGKSGETFCTYAKKGFHLYVEGVTVHDKYTDKQGVEKTITKVKVTEWKLLDKKGDVDSAPQTARQPVPKGNENYNPSDYTPPSGGGSNYDDDIPF